MSWQEELTRNVTGAPELAEKLALGPEEVQRMEEILARYPMSISRYYLSLIDFSDPHDPIRKMCIPSIEETELGGSFDTSGEKSNTVVTGMQHKYGETTMILSNNQCAMYCRHCFRKRLVGLSDAEVAKHFEDMLAYIRGHEEVNNVLISGGDAFLNDNARLEKFLSVLSEIRHVDFIRFGTRTPVVFPERITGDPELLELLGRYARKKQIYVVTQFNHPRELTEQAREAVRCILRQGIPMRNQTVLLKGVNDDPAVMGDLLRRLTAAGVLPYYVFQCRPVTGVKNQFQVPIERGYKILEQSKAMQNGLGKGFRYCLSHPAGKLEILGKAPDGAFIFKYHQAKDPADDGRIFMKRLAADQCWIERI